MQEKQNPSRQTTGNAINSHSNFTANGQNRQGIDVEVIKDSIDILTVIGQHVPGLKKVGHEWETCCPFHEEKTPSFKVNPAKGLWNCFGCGRGGDIFDFVRELEKCSFLEAKDFLSENYLAGNSSANQSFQRPLAKISRKEKAVWQPVLPVPDNAPEPPSYHYKHGKVTCRWIYISTNGHVLFHICRFDSSDGKKTILPQSYCRNQTGKSEWRWHGIPTPRPLYNLHQFANRPGEPVLVVEGEKAADAAQQLFPDFIATTSPNGSKSAGKAVWSPVTGRHVVIWRDNDEPGKEYADDVARLAMQAGALSVAIVDVPTSFPSGWDLADALPEGIEMDDLRRFFEKAQPLTHTEITRQETDAVENMPTIQWVGGNLPIAVKMAETSLLQTRNGQQIFQRGGQLVRVIRVAKPEPFNGIERWAGSIMIVPLNDTWLQLLLTEVATWIKFDARSQEMRKINCPMEVSRAMLSKLGDWPFQQLTAVIETPTLRPDGSILEIPRYDNQTGFLFEPGKSKFPPVPKNPTKEDALAALNILSKLLEGFPFQELAHQSVAIASILTALIRRSLRTSPMFIFSAPKMGAGKSLLADATARIATGNPATVMTHSADPNEERKRILSVLMEGDAVICIDNIEQNLGSEALCSILTQTSYKDRILGESRTVSVSTNATWLATGNNVTVIGDLSTRVLVCRLDPKMERPEERRFKVNLHQEIPKQREKLVIAGLTILRAFVCAGKPRQDVAQFGRFEEWSDWVRGSLIWLGLPDPVETRRSVESNDPIRSQMLMVLTAWHDGIGCSEITTSELISKAKELAKPNFDWHESVQERTQANSALLESLVNATGGNVGQEVNPRKVSKWISRIEGRIESGMRIEKAGRVSKDGSVKWRLQKNTPITDLADYTDSPQATLGKVSGHIANDTFVDRAGVESAKSCKSVSQPSELDGEIF